MKTIVKAARKALELTPVIAVIIVFTISSFILPPAIKYTFLRTQIHNVEDSAKRNGYFISGVDWVENWGDGRREKYKELTDELAELISISKVAELCNTYGTPETKLARNTVLIAIGVMWILSICWMVITAEAEIEYQMRMYEKRKKKQEKGYLTGSNRKYRCMSRAYGRY